ncbi:hypothetical protein FYC77_10085 [Natrialba swarupiae]|uniref:Uncharacterized protein n=1 Tax=Natrialba swarupiae TaxID=2448032 RepID=A0A5D5AM06_9EURY|nr:hypothetical protein [Natrialba swarupiae]TYT62043.1 hypothetical protein FYC77_10085 [Natrialba swarupiae]
MPSTSNPDPHVHAGPTDASSVSESVVSPLRASAFWATIALPIVALVLLATGTVSVSLLTTVSFLTAYGTCAVAGHNHSPN